MTPARKKKQPLDITPEPGRWVARRTDGHYFKEDGFTSSDLSDAVTFDSAEAAQAFAAREAVKDETWVAIEHWRAAGYAADPSTAAPTAEVSVIETPLAHILDGLHDGPAVDIPAVDPADAAVAAAIPDEPADASLEAEVVDGAEELQGAVLEGVIIDEAGGSQQAFPGFEAAGAASAPTTGVALNAPGVARVLARAVKSYADDLEKEAKRVRDLGYDRESKVLEADAGVLREDVLQQLEPQARIPLGTVSLTQAIETRLQGKLRRRVRQALAELPREVTVTQEDHKAAMHAKLDDFEVVIGSVAAITTALVVGIVREAAARGIAAGRLAREVTPDLLGAQAVDVVTDRESA